MKIGIKIVASCLLLFITGCISTNMESVVDPRYKNNFLVKRMIVKGVNLSLIDESQMINALKKAASEYNVSVINSQEVFLNTSESTSTEVLQIAQKHSADAILCFFMRKGASSRYLGNYAHTQISSYGNYATATTFFGPGIYSERRKIDIAFTMIDAKTGETIWIADGNSFGDEDDFVDFSDLADDISRKVFSMLAEKGLLRRKVK